MDNLFLNILEFLYNNIVTVSIIVTSFILIYVTFRLAYLEYRFNQRLSVKKIFFRERRSFKVKQFTLRRAFAILLALALVGLIIFRAYGNPISYQANTLSVNTEQEALDIYETFNEKFFSNPFSSTLVVPQDSEDPFVSVQADSFEGFDFVTENDSHVYVLNQTGIQTLIKDSEGASYQGSTIIDNPTCEVERMQPQGLAFVGDYLAVVAVKSYGQCVSNPQPYVLRTTETIVLLYDYENTLELVERFVVRGHMTNLSVQGDDILLSTNTWIPFARSNFILESYLPYVIEDGQRRNTLLQNIPYIENSNPNSFVTVAKVSTNSLIVDSESILTDYQNDIHFREDAAVILVDYLNFNPVSEVFEFRNPVDSVDTSIVQFNHFDEDVYYFRTQIATGQQLENESLFFVANGIKLFTKDDSDLYRINFYNEMLRVDLEKELNIDANIERIVYDQNHFYIQTDATQLNHFIYRDFANGETVQVANQNDSFFKDSFRRLTSNRHIAINFFDNNRLTYFIFDSLPGSFIYNETFTIRKDYSNLGIEIDNETALGVQYIEEEQLLLIPPYRFSDIDNLSPSTQIIEGYYLVGLTPQLETVNMSRLAGFRSPFSYRAVYVNGRILHLTPGGFIVTDGRDISQTVKTVFFPNAD